MPRKVGSSNYHGGSRIHRTRKARKTRGKKKQARKDTET